MYSRVPNRVRYDCNALHCLNLVEKPDWMARPMGDSRLDEAQVPRIPSWSRCRSWSLRRSRWERLSGRPHDHLLLEELRGQAAGFSSMEQQPGVAP
jgi:hypothetical protein